MAACVSNKKMYLTETLAEDALIDARSRFQYAHGSGPVAVYRCDDCGHYHLTSRGPVNARLATLLADGTIRRRQDASDWERKLKR